MIWGGGSDDVVVQLRTNLEISTDPVVTQNLHQWKLSSTLEMAFFPGMKLRLNRGIIGCSPNSVPMLFVGFEGFYGESWSFLGIIIQWVCPTIPWPNNPGCSNWAFRLFCARRPATPVGGHTISRRRQRCLPANHRTARRCGYVTSLDSGVEEK